MTTGMIMPGWSLVLALNSLQNAMMLTPCCPNAGPTGGAGLACPAGICNLIIPVIFFAITKLSVLIGNSRAQEEPVQKPLQSTHSLSLFHLPVFQFDRRIAPENVDGH